MQPNPQQLSDERPLVSVLFSAHNAGAALRPAVLSVLAQTYQQIELILVDEGSSDASFQSLADIDDARITLLTTQEEGSALAFNLAKDNAKGSYLTFQSSRGFSHPERIAAQVQIFLQQPETQVVLTGRDLIVEGKRVDPQHPKLDQEASKQWIQSSRTPSLNFTGMYVAAPIADFQFQSDSEDGCLNELAQFAAQNGNAQIVDRCLCSWRTSGQPQALSGTNFRAAEDTPIAMAPQIEPASTAAPACQSPLKLTLFGCAPDTGNLGVSALCFSVLSGLKREAPNSLVTVFDNARGLRWGSAWMGDHALSYASHGGRYSRRLHETSSLWNMRMSARFGGLRNAGAKAILEANAVLDVSGGDSFTDLYGRKRFEQTIYPKRLALEFGVPLVLLPQTYGPFREARSLRIAKRLVRGSRIAWARDTRSFDALKDLLGSDFDPQRHRCGVDLAFGLARTQPKAGLPPATEAFLREDREKPVVGINVSGLIYHDPLEARDRYGLKANYRQVINQLIERFLEQSDANVLLVPHVGFSSHAGGDNDHVVCTQIAKDYAAAGRGNRLRVLDQNLDQSEIKGVIARLDWFNGTRMHSTIAALSSGVPVAAIAYSGKTLGVFESCNVGDQVVDPRDLETDEVVEQVWQSWIDRDKIRTTLGARLPEVFSMCRQQMAEIVQACEQSSETKARA